MGRIAASVVLAGVLLALGCGPGPGSVAPDAQVVPALGALNERFEVWLGGAPDPLSVTERSVSVRDEAGRPLPARVSGTKQGLAVELVVDESLWGAPPARVVVHVAGGADAHALLRADGRPWPTPLALPLQLERRLVDAGEPGLELADLASPWRVRDGCLQVDFRGVVDPESVDGRSVPLFPRHEGALLAPRYGDVRWAVTGGRTRIEVRLEDPAAELWCSTRRLGLRALDGSAPEPRMEARVSPG